MGVFFAAGFHFIYPFFRSWELAYAGWVYIKLQTLALLNGRISLGDTPFELLPDLAWGSGVQQVWGLAVPLLYLPFEWISQTFWQTSFGDRIVFFIYFSCVCGAIGWSISSHFRKHFWLSSLAVAACLLVILMAPLFGGLLSKTFSHYDEYALMGTLWALLGFALYFHKHASRSLPLAIFAALVFASLPHFRPTLTVYSLGFWLATLVAYGNKQEPHRHRTFVLTNILFVVSAVALLWLNQHRFGSPLEFGHNLNSFGNPVKLFEWKFGAPIQHESLIAQASDLIKSMTFDRILSGDTHHIPEHADVFGVLRSRSLYATAFSWWDLAFSLAVFLAVIFRLLVSLRRTTTWRDCGEIFSTKILLLTGIPFLGLFVFYMGHQHLATRYFLDFFPALVLLKLSFVVFACRKLFSGYKSGSTLHDASAVLNSNADRFDTRYSNHISAALSSEADRLGTEDPSHAPTTNALPKNRFFKKLIFWFRAHRRAVLASGVIALIAIELYQFVDRKTHFVLAQRELRTLDNGLSFMGRYGSERKPIPTRVTCTDSTRFDPLTFGDKTGWYPDQDCRVSMATQLFFEDFTCITLRYEMADPESPFTSIIAPRVKQGIHYLVEVNTTKEANLFVKTFCNSAGSYLASTEKPNDDSDFGSSSKTSGPADTSDTIGNSNSASAHNFTDWRYRIVFIGWITSEALSLEPLPLRLLEVAVD